jgi:parallel beta-helix repeat protein
MADFFTVPGGAGSGDGSSFANGFDWAGVVSVDDWITNQADPGDVLYALAGTYNAATQVTTARDGLITNPIRIIGVADQALTPAVHGALPFFDFGANNRGMVLDNYWEVRNVRFDSAENTYTLRMDNGGLIVNCESMNTGTGNAFRLNASGGRVVNCIAEADPAANAIHIQSTGSTVYGCQINGGSIGIRLISSNNSIVGNIIRDCGVGISGLTSDNIQVFLNTINGCTFGILSTDGQQWVVHDNILSNNGTPAQWSAGEQLTNQWDRNTWFNSAAPSNVTKGPDAINADPQFVDAAGFDFRVRAETSRNLGLNLTTTGAVPPSIYEGGETGVGGFTGVGLDLSDDLGLLDDLETITLDDKEIQGCHRNEPDLEQEEVATEGVYLRRDVTFLLPVGEAIYTVGKEPTVGGTIIDDAGEGVSYQIMTIRRPKIGTPGQPLTGDWYGAACVSLRFSDAFGLANTVTLLQAEYGKDAALGKITSHVPLASFTDVPAKIMLQPSVSEQYAGQNQFVEQYDIYVDGDIGQVNNGDLLQDENGKRYKITGYRLRNRMGELPVIECELRQVP